MAERRLVRAIPAVRTPMHDRRKARETDPKYHYYPARDDPDRIRYLVETFGYEIVREGEVKVKDPTSTDGAVRVGGDVLLRCKKQEYERRQAERNAYAVRSKLGPRETFKSEARKRDVETIDLSKEKYGPMSDVLGTRDKDPKLGDKEEEA